MFLSVIPDLRMLSFMPFGKCTQGYQAISVNITYQQTWIVWKEGSVPFYILFHSGCQDFIGFLFLSSSFCSSLPTLLCLFSSLHLLLFLHFLLVQYLGQWDILPTSRIWFKKINFLPQNPHFDWLLPVSEGGFTWYLFEESNYFEKLQYLSERQ